MWVYGMDVGSGWQNFQYIIYMDIQHIECILIYFIAPVQMYIYRWMDRWIDGCGEGRNAFET